MFERFDEHVRRSLFFARYEAGRSGSEVMGPEHLLLGLLREADPTMAEILGELGIDLGVLRRELLGRVVASEYVSGAVDVPLADETKKALALAVREADGLGQSMVESTHLLLGLLNLRGSTAAQYLEAHALEALEIRHQLMILSRETTAEDVEPGESCLEEYSRDLTKMAADGVFDPLIGRESELERVVQIVCRRTKNNPLLLGDSGVGKTAIVEGLADRIARGDVPELLAERRILALDLSLVVAGTKYRGQFEERLKGILSELKDHPEIIVFIDEIHSLIGTGSAEGSLDAANILKPALSRGEITCIGATTMREYRRHVEKDRALSRRFQVVDVREPDEEQTIRILHGIRDRYESFHGVTYHGDAIVAAVELASRYITDSAFPDKAIDLIDEAGARVKLARVNSTSSVHQVQADIRQVVSNMKDAISGKRFEEAVRLREEELRLREGLARLEKEQAAISPEQTVVVRGDIEQVVSSWTGIPVTALSADEARRLSTMEEILRSRVVGQDDAINAVARAIRRARVGVTTPGRPVGSFIFLGPSGVGKTEVARQLATFLFQDERRLIRFDMSEYSEKHTVSRLIGSPPGYVGFEEGGQLTERVRRRPYSVVLLDEIEKAHPDLYNLLLQVLDDGRLTDSFGNLVDFTHSLIIMTSNLGSRSLVGEGRMGFGGDRVVASSGESREVVEKELRRHFPPEFLNRLDDVVVFGPLESESMLAVTRILLGETSAILERQRVVLEYEPEVANWLLERVVDEPMAGARPLRKLIRMWIEDPVADVLIRHGGDGPLHLVAAIDEDRPVVAVRELQAVADSGEERS